MATTKQEGEKSSAADRGRETPASGNPQDIGQLSPELLKQLTQALGAGALTVQLREPDSTQAQQDLRRAIHDRLSGVEKVPLPRNKQPCITPISVAFPGCSDVLLSLIRPQKDNDDIGHFFDDYFQFAEHSVVAYPDKLKDSELGLDGALLACTDHWCGKEDAVQIESATPAQNPDICPSFSPATGSTWPPVWCLPPSCVTLAGMRPYNDAELQKAPRPATRIRRLFVADVVWLYYMERLGIFRILGVLLDDYAYKGQFPISSGAVRPGIRDDLVSLVLEAMVRQNESGTASRARSRDSTYRRALGWTSEAGREMNADTQRNDGFNTLFPRFIQLALQYYRDKSLAQAVRGTTLPSRTSVATLVTIGDTLDLLKKSFDAFDYGRNYTNTLAGIVWALAGMSLVRELRTTLGIPDEFDSEYEYIPAAYTRLVEGRQATPTQTNRYVAHRESANDARKILLDLEVVNHKDDQPGGELEVWLNSIENRVEGYRTSFRELTNRDLGVAAEGNGSATAERV